MLEFEIKPLFRDEPIPSSSNKVIRWLGLDNLEPEKAVTSHFVSSKVLFFIRLPITIYCFIVMCADIIYTAKSGEFKHFFAYFTDLTFVGLLAYLLTTSYHHARYLRSSRSNKRPNSFFHQPSVANYLYVYLYHTVIVFNVQTPVIFWALLAKEKLFDAHLSVIDVWTSITLHTVTLLIIMVEIALNRMTVSINMVLLVFGTVLVYLCLVFIIFATEHWWVYSFLDWSYGPGVSVWYIAISVFIVICFFFQVAIHKLRDFIAKRYMKKYRVDLFNHQEKSTDASITQNSNFEPLASTIGGQSHMTFADSSIAPSILYY